MAKCESSNGYGYLRARARSSQHAGATEAELASQLASWRPRVEVASGDIGRTVIDRWRYASHPTDTLLHVQAVSDNS